MPAVPSCPQFLGADLHSIFSDISIVLACSVDMLGCSATWFQECRPLHSSWKTVSAFIFLLPRSYRSRGSSVPLISAGMCSPFNPRPLDSFTLPPPNNFLPQSVSHTHLYSIFWNMVLTSGVTCLCGCPSLLRVERSPPLRLTFSFSSEGCPRSTFTKACHCSDWTVEL